MVETRPLMSSTLSTGTSVSTIVPSNYAYLSALSEAFVKKIRALERIRELFCANVYPESFTGQEAIVSYAFKKRERVSMYSKYVCEIEYTI